jgi:hypothetical protein
MEAGPHVVNPRRNFLALCHFWLCGVDRAAALSARSGSEGGWGIDILPWVTLKQIPAAQAAGLLGTPRAAL